MSCPKHIARLVGFLALLTGGLACGNTMITGTATPVLVAAVAAPAPLESTSWKLLRLRGAPVTLVETQREPILVLQPGGRRVGGFGGCNQFTGAYALDGDRLAFSRMSSTMKACVHGGELERAFFDALGQIQRWRIAGQQLELLDVHGEAVAVFVAAPPVAGIPRAKRP